MIKNLELIAAIGKNNELGYNNELIWKIKEDLKQFKQLTMGKNLIMGYNTYMSLPKKLDGRNYIILTRKNMEIENATIYHYREDLIKNIKKDERYIVIGGAQIYRLFIDDVYVMYLTQIDDTFKLADTYFPTFDDGNYEKRLLMEGNQDGINYKQYKYVRSFYER